MNQAEKSPTAAPSSRDSTNSWPKLSAMSDSVSAFSCELFLLVGHGRAGRGRRCGEMWQVVRGPGAA